MANATVLPQASRCIDYPLPAASAITTAQRIALQLKLKFSSSQCSSIYVQNCLFVCFLLSDVNTDASETPMETSADESQDVEMQVTSETVATKPESLPSAGGPEVATGVGGRQAAGTTALPLGKPTGLCYW